MDRIVMEAATTGDAAAIRAVMGPDVVSGRTSVGNTCLHIVSTSIQNHQEFCKAVVARDHSLLAAVNDDGETPLLVAVTSGNISLASFFLERYRSDHGLSEALTKQDKSGCNALHHAIRSGHRQLALDLIAVESAAPALSGAVNKYGESPMFIAVMRDYEDVFDAILNTAGSAHAGAGGYNALHAAVRNGNSGEPQVGWGSLKIRMIVRRLHFTSFQFFNAITS